MSATGKTINYNLPIFNTGDTTAWADFNKAMTLLDDTLKNIEVFANNTNTKTDNNTNAISDIETSVESLQNETDINSVDISNLKAKTNILEKHDNEQDLKISNVESVGNENSVKISEVETFINRYSHNHVSGSDKATSNYGTVSSCDIYYEIADYEDMKIIDFSVEIRMRVTQSTDILTFIIPTLKNILIMDSSNLSTSIVSERGFLENNTNGVVNSHLGMFTIHTTPSLKENSDYHISFSGRQYKIK